VLKHSHSFLHIQKRILQTLLVKEYKTMESMWQLYTIFRIQGQKMYLAKRKTVNTSIIMVNKHYSKITLYCCRALFDKILTLLKVICMVFVSVTEIISISRISLQVIFYLCWHKNHFTAVMLGNVKKVVKGVSVSVCKVLRRYKACDVVCFKASSKYAPLTCII
jgi:hypothetical protein